MGYRCGRFQALLDSDLFLPEGWANDRERCREAHIPDTVAYRPKWRIALDQVQHALGNGVRFSWLTFDEYYGSKPQFLAGLEALGQNYVAEVPRDFRCFPTLPRYRSLRREFSSKEVYNVCRWSPAFIDQPWQDLTLERETVPPQTWSIKAAQVHLSRDGRPTDRLYGLIVAWNRATGEHKYFLANAPPTTAPPTLLRVAFSRAHVEHLFRAAKSEIGLAHFEGRSYVGLLRHLVLCQTVLHFLAEQTDRLRGEKSAEMKRCQVCSVNTHRNNNAGDWGATGRRFADRCLRFHPGSGQSHCSPKAAGSGTHSRSRTRFLRDAYKNLRFALQDHAVEQVARAES